jgi:hypothetical protein
MAGKGSFRPASQSNPTQGVRAPAAARKEAGDYKNTETGLSPAKHFGPQSSKHSTAPKHDGPGLWKNEHSAAGKHSGTGTARGGATHVETNFSDPSAQCWSDSDGCNSQQSGN